MRAALTFLAILIGAVFVVSMFINTRKQATENLDTPQPVVAQPVAQATPGEQTPPTSQASTSPAPAASTQTASTQSGVEPAAATSTPAPASGAVFTLPLRAVGDAEARVATLGANDPKLGYKLQADLSAWGASILFVTLTDYHTHVTGGEHFVLQQPLRDPADPSRVLLPFAANFIEVNGNPVDLVGQKWKLLEPAHYRTTLHADPGAPKGPLCSKAIYSIDIVDALGAKVLTVIRVYTLAVEQYEVRCDQQIINHSGQPLRIVWHQNAQGDVPNDEGSSGIGSLSYIAGYHDLDYDPKRTHIFTNKSFVARSEVLAKYEAEKRFFWPVPDLKQKTELVWLGSVNRYFAAVTHRPLPEALATVAPALDDRFASQGMSVLGTAPTRSEFDHRTAALTLTSKPIDLAPGKSAELDLCLFVGPRKPELLSSPAYEVFAFDHLIVYALGCTWCTFQWLAKGLLTFLKVIHAATFDWSLAIIALVLVVRLILHPITKRAQINMAKMQKQMASLQPELEKIKKKYKDEPDKINSETLRLYREKNINYSQGVLGCLPMLLQAPIWIAFYAMIYFAIELRHQPAFYGFFQWITGGKWAFLSDLSVPDNFFLLPGGGFTFSLFGFTHVTIAGLNVIPILLGVVFYFQQKLTMPVAQTEQQQQQQAIMKWMTVLFPFMLYTMPAGLTLYMCASTGAGIVDSLIVKRHIKREEESGRLFAPPPPPKPGSFAYKMAQIKEEFMRKAAEAQAEQERQKRNKK